MDENYKKPKNLADQVVRLLDDNEISFPDRLRLIIQYLLYRDGLLPSDTQKLLAHAQLPAQDGEVIHNLDLLGAHVSRSMKDTRPLSQSPFGRKQAPQNPSEEESELSRYDPAIRPMLEEHIRGTLDQSTFPFTKPHLDATDGLLGQENVSQASLRSAKPTWARTRPSALEPRQRIIVFMAGGASYSESRACYEVSRLFNKDVFLATSHMLTPSLYLRQVGDLSVDKRRLDLPAERPRPQAPAHLFEREPLTASQTYAKQQSTVSQQPQPLASGVAAMNLNPNHANANISSNGGIKGHAVPPASLIPVQPAITKLNKKEKEKDRDSEKKKKHHFFGSKK